MKKNDALKEYALGPRSGRDGQIIRVDGNWNKLDPNFGKKAAELGMHTVTTTLHDNYFMFIKLNYHMPVSPTDVKQLSAAEFELRRRQFEALKLLKEVIPGSENAFIARTELPGSHYQKSKNVYHAIMISPTRK